MRIEPTVSIWVNDVKVSERQLRALRALREHGSKASAARSMGVSAPVFHRYIKSLEEAIGVPLIHTSPRGSSLTEEGRHLVEEHSAIEGRIRHRERYRVACTPVTEHLLMSIISGMDGDIDLVISDDGNNMRDLQAGLVDLVVLDDPQYLYDADGVQWEEVGETSMVHVDKGPQFIRYLYGAQRIAFQHLDVNGIPYEVRRDTMLLDELLESDMSFFVDEILLLRKGIRLRSSTPQSFLTHSISAVYRVDAVPTKTLVREMQRRLSK